jgi:uncharacterized protein YdaU (DUF1376 family)
MRAAWWWIDRWQKSTAFKEMTLEEQGAYRNLLDELWLRDGVLPNNERLLARLCGDASAWSRVRNAVMGHFTFVDGGWRHPTHDVVAGESQRRADKQAAYRARLQLNGTSNATGNATGNAGGNATGNAPVGPPNVTGNAGASVTRSPSPSPSLKNPSRTTKEGNELVKRGGRI